MPKTKVLLSYARIDGSADANALRTTLETARQDAWLDTSDLVAGQEWGPEIENMIRATHAVLLILTTAAAQSANVQKEIEFANSIQKRVIPFRVGDVALPAWVRDTHVVTGAAVNDVAVLPRLLAAVDAVWEDVRSELSALTLQSATEVAPLLRQLEDYCTVRPVTPEVVRVGAEFARQISIDVSAGKQLVDLAADIKDGSYFNDAWRMARAYKANLGVMKPLLMQFISKLDIQPVSVLPIVLVVMTPAEATELETGAAFDNDTQALRSYFDQEIRPKVSGIAGWRSRYQEQPADWRPFGGGPDRSLRKTIEGAIGDWLQRTPRAERLRAKYLDIRTINAPANREQLNQLRLDGCLIVIDHVSLCHPRLFNEYRRSLLDVFPQTVLLKLAPFDHVPIEEFEVAVPFKQRFDSFFFERMTLDNDLRNNGVAGSELYLRQWLSQHFVNRGNSQQSAGGIRASWNT